MTMEYYLKIAKNNDIKDNEVLLFTNHGVYKIPFDEFDNFHEEVSVSRGEEGKSHKYYFAMTSTNYFHEVENGYIWRSLTMEDF